MDGPYSLLAKNVFAVNNNCRKFSEAMKEGSFYGTELKYGGKKYIITDGSVNFGNLEKISKEIEEIINE